MSEFVQTAAELTLNLEGSAVGSIANNLTTTVEGYALDARQGQVLDEKKLDKARAANNLTTVEEGWVLDARQGRLLDELKLNAANVFNGLTQTEKGYALDARQGKALDEKKINLSDIVNNLTGGGTAKVLSAEQGKELKTQIDLNNKTTKATLSSSSWSGSGPYTQSVTVSGMTSSNEPTVDVDMSGATTLSAMENLSEAWGLLLKAVTGSNTITFYFSEKPDINIPIKVKGR